MGLENYHRHFAGSVQSLEVNENIDVNLYCPVLIGVYYLGRSLEGLVVKEGKAQAVVTEGRRIQCDQVSCPSNLLITWAQVVLPAALVSFLPLWRLLPPSSPVLLLSKNHAPAS